MECTVKQLAYMAGVSARTLHYYDQIGLLKPAYIGNNGYRFYTEKEFFKLQQIIFFRELDFDLDRIKRIFESSRFDEIEVLEDQKNLIELKREKLGKLIKLINKNIKNMKNEKQAKVTDEDLRNSFDDGKYNEYKKEARERWGRDMVQRSESIVKNMSKEKLAHIKAEGEEINRALARNMMEGKSVDSPEIQAIIERHFNHIIQFYDKSWPLLKIYRGLGRMYVDDPRFTANYNKYHPDLALFMCDAMQVFCGRKEKEDDKK